MGHLHDEIAVRATTLDRGRVKRIALRDAREMGGIVANDRERTSEISKQTPTRG